MKGIENMEYPKLVFFDNRRIRKQIGTPEIIRNTPTQTLEPHIIPTITQKQYVYEDGCLVRYEPQINAPI